jgi:hypothetical protein
VTAPSSTISAAVDEVREHFASKSVEVLPDDNGGVFVIINDIEVGPRYTPATTWLGFQLNAAYPASDVYPHFVGMHTRTDNQGYGDGITPTTWRGRPALQLSRRSRAWNPQFDTAALKAEKVITWLTTR